ncbi:MAG: hypothetical protein AAGA15_02830 [Pseudomonadota bacterium]
MSLPRKRAINDFGWSLAAGLTALFCALSAVPAYGEATWDCLEPELRQELNQKLQFQDDFAAAVKSQRPDLKDIAMLSASASKEAFKMRFSRIVWLWEVDRARLAHADAFWTYPWEESDTTAWRLADDSHAATYDLAKDLQTQVQMHPDALEYRSFNSENRSKEPFLSLLTEFGPAISSQRDRVAACF